MIRATSRVRVGHRLASSDSTRPPERRLRSNTLFLMPTLPNEPRAPSAIAIAMTGALCLGVLVDIGCFAFTPVLPAMLAQGRIDLAGAGTLTSLSYVGYLLGAGACSLPLRLAAGVASAFAFVYDTGWCLNQLALRGRTAIGGLMCAGPGLGIAGNMRA